MHRPKSHRSHHPPGEEPFILFLFSFWSCRRIEQPPTGRQRRVLPGKTHTHLKKAKEEEKKSLEFSSKAQPVFTNTSMHLWLHDRPQRSSFLCCTSVIDSGAHRALEGQLPALPSQAHQCTWLTFPSELTQ